MEIFAAIAKDLQGWWRGYEWRPANISGARGALLFENGAIVAAASFAFDREDRAAGIYIMRNPDKLAHLAGMATSLS